MIMKRKFKYAIFDKDGVLTDSVAVSSKIFKKQAREILGAEISENEFKDLVGTEWRETLKSYNKNDSIIEKFIKKFHAVLTTEVAESVLFMEVRDIVVILYKKGLNLFISSSAPQKTVDDFLSREKLDKFFLLGRGNFGVPLDKREHIKEFARALNLDVATFGREAFIIEDMVHGIEAAKELGLFAIGLETSLTAPELKAAGADVVLPNHAALLEYLKDNL